MKKLDYTDQPAFDELLAILKKQRASEPSPVMFTQEDKAPVIAKYLLGTVFFDVQRMRIHHYREIIKPFLNEIFNGPYSKKKPRKVCVELRLLMIQIELKIREKHFATLAKKRQEAKKQPEKIVTTKKPLTLQASNTSKTPQITIKKKRIISKR